MRLVWVTVCAAGMAGVACAQSVPTPGAPSIPLTGVAAANVGANGITYQYGIEFVTVDGRVNGQANAPWAGNGTPGDNAIGHGSVNYAYRISRYEVNSNQWAAFYDAANQVQIQTGQALPFVTPPSHWGGTFQNGHYVANGAAAMAPTGNISWRVAAMYANWLCNGQAVTLAAFMNGEYDVTTFGYIGNIFTDQAAHNPGAQFWIPTLDEWILASHYDRNRNGPGQGGYWQYSITSDTLPVGGMPQWGGAQVNAGFDLPNSDEFSVPLGAYGTARGVMSPWGLLDTGGGTQEWTEGIFQAGTQARYRIDEGSFWASSPSYLNADAIMFNGGDFPSDDAFWHGLRIAAAVPTPSAGLACTLFGMCALRRRRPS